MMITRKFLLAFVLMFSFSSVGVASSADSRVKTFVYSESEVFKVNASYGYQSFIELSEKEHIKTIALGNSIGWSMNPVGNKIFLRPMQKDLVTNMVVVTDKRTYVFDLFSDKEEGEENKKKSRETDYILRFYYPDEVSSEDDGSSKDSLSIDGKLYELDYSSLRRHYSFKGKGDFELKEVMNNPHLTFFKFEGSNIPRIFVVNPDRSETQAKMWRFKEYLLIEGVHKKLRLRYQDSMLEVVNDDLE